MSNTVSQYGTQHSAPKGQDLPENKEEDDSCILDQ